MTAEILSIIAVCISGVTAIFSATIPAILNYKMKKAELVAQRKRELEQENDAKFEIFYQAHLRVLNEFSKLYVKLKNEPTPFNKSKLTDFIYNTAPEFRQWLKKRLLEFAEKIQSYNKGDDLDNDYQNCVRGILSSYGVQVTADTPDVFMSDILRIVLKERFEKLQRATSKDLQLYRN